MNKCPECQTLKVFVSCDSIYQGPYTFDPSTVTYIREKLDEFDDIAVTFSNGEKHFFYAKDFYSAIERYNKKLEKLNEQSDHRTKTL